MALAIFHLGFPTTLTPSTAANSSVSSPEEKQKIEQQLTEAEYYIEIPSLHIKAPIITGIDMFQKSDYMPALTQGVALANNTSNLTAETGNSFIFGHSNHLTFKEHLYKRIFANLNQLKPDQEIIIKTPEGMKRYTVTETFQTDSHDLSVIDQTEERIITLMTCWPLGTDAKRWIVRATLSDFPNTSS